MAHFVTDTFKDKIELKNSLIKTVQDCKVAQKMTNDKDSLLLHETSVGILASNGV